MRPKPFKWKPRPGQEFANRARFHIHRLLTAREIPITQGLKCCASRTLYKFINGRSDMTITMLENVASELGTSVLGLFRPRPPDYIPADRGAPDA